MQCHPHAVRHDVAMESLDYSTRYKGMDDEQAISLFRDEESLVTYCLDAVEFVLDGSRLVDAREVGHV